MDKPIPAHQERINEELPIILNAIGRDKYWRDCLFFETGYQWLVNQMGIRAYIEKQADWELMKKRQESEDPEAPQYVVTIIHNNLAVCEEAMGSYNLIKSNRAFWNWWRLRWEERDFMFGEQLKKQSISRKEARELYFKYHNLPALCQNGRLCQSFIQILPDLKKKAKNGKKKFALAQ